MVTFAYLTLTELGPILGIFVGMLGGFYALLKFILSQAEKTAEADRRERQALAKAVDRMATATEINAQANKQNGREAKQRNGHLAELAIEGQKLSAKNDLLILEAISKIPITQQVHEQKVDNQIVQNETVNHKETK